MRKQTIEEYVEVIYVIQNNKERVHTNDVAQALNLNPASVTEMFQKLMNEKYIDYQKYSGVKLTEKGKKVAVSIKNRHDTLKNFLVLLGVDKEIADKDACRIEHNVNRKTMKKLRKFLEFAKFEDVCTRWLDHYKHFDETGEFIICKPADEKKCPVHGKK